MTMWKIDNQTKHTEINKNIEIVEYRIITNKCISLTKIRKLMLRVTMLRIKCCLVCLEMCDA